MNDKLDRLYREEIDFVKRNRKGKLRRLFFSRWISHKVVEKCIPKSVLCDFERSLKGLEVVATITKKGGSFWMMINLYDLENGETRKATHKTGGQGLPKLYPFDLKMM